MKTEIPKINPKWARHYRHLIALQAQLLAESHELSEDSKQPVSTFSMHPADASSEEADRDLTLRLLSAERDALCEVQEAIKRIEENRYGCCEVTGAAIPAERLRVIPWTRFIAEVAAELEKRGQLARHRVAPLISLKSERTAAAHRQIDSKDRKESDHEKAPGE